MRIKMRLLLLLVICMTGIRCATPTATVPEKNYEYRYNVEVTYTRPDNAELFPGEEDEVTLVRKLLDSGQIGGWDGAANLMMKKTGANTYKYVISKVYVQKPGELIKHRLGVWDMLRNPRHANAEDISIPGAYDLEARDMLDGTNLLFRMAKN